MAFVDLTIPGVAGTVSTSTSFWTGVRFTVDGVPVKAHGLARNKLTLPGTGAPVQARIKGGVYPVIVVGDRKYPTGPPAPLIQKVLAVLPVATIAFGNAFFGILFAIGGISVNYAILRSDRLVAAKVALMLGTVVAALLLNGVAAAAVHSIFAK